MVAIRAAQVGDMFQKKINKLFSSMPNVFSIADDILIAGFDEQGKDHNETLNEVLQIYRQENLKCNKEKCLFRCTNIPFLGKVISWQGVTPNPRKGQTVTEMLPPKSRK